MSYDKIMRNLGKKSWKTLTDEPLIHNEPIEAKDNRYTKEWRAKRIRNYKRLQ